MPVGVASGASYPLEILLEPAGCGLFAQTVYLYLETDEGVVSHKFEFGGECLDDRSVLDQSSSLLSSVGH